MSTENLIVPIVKQGEEPTTDTTPVAVSNPVPGESEA